MIVIFVSECEKKSLRKTRRILDSFAQRIGDRVWQTVITNEGLLAVRKTLTITATKNSAISCHWIRSRKKSELLWIIGNKNKFNYEGCVPVNRTQNKKYLTHIENNWEYLPIIQALTAMSALFHDWGKASKCFQNKLKNPSSKDSLRHEWVSCLLLRSIVQSSGNTESDEFWLKLLAENKWDEKEIKKRMLEISFDDERIFEDLPPFAQMIIWIILSHHYLPMPPSHNDFVEEKIYTLKEAFSLISSRWGYRNNEDRLKDCLNFPKGLLKSSNKWISCIKRWARKSNENISLLHEIFDNNSWKLILQYSRMSLMLGDYYFSSLSKNKNNERYKNYSQDLWANTDKNNKSQCKQYLDEHLIGVYEQSMNVVQNLKQLTDEMPFITITNSDKIKQPSEKNFQWQDTAVNEIKKNRKRANYYGKGWFIINMASTGKGKTIANAKIINELSESENSLRFILALGLRTLTLQTGEAYQEDLGIGKNDLAIKIGSLALLELYNKTNIDSKDNHSNSHENQDNSDFSYEEIGSESLESLMSNEIVYEEECYQDFLTVLFNKGNENKAFLCKPVLICTIDQIILATETTQKGKYLLPYLRLLSSDLIIDEVDDFDVKDLIPLARLVHLAGMLGRKVVMSSATIPPSLAEGFYNSYEKGYHIYCSFMKMEDKNINAMWVDEFNAKISTSNNFLGNYRKEHNNFIEKRCSNLKNQPIKHLARIIKCENLNQMNNKIKENSREAIELEAKYFNLIQENIIKLHENNYIIDEVSNKKISFGVVRVTNIRTCIELTKYLLCSSSWSNEFTPRIMPYHARQILLLRHYQEKYLDRILNRKEKNNNLSEKLCDDRIRIKNILSENIIFVLIATPVEEVGRDHDFDWALIEPSSYRSIIQLSGRVLRHRIIEKNISEPNIAIMNLNLRGLFNQEIAFTKPGFEFNNNIYKLKSKNLEDNLTGLINEQKLIINAIPRISDSDELLENNEFVKLEHDRITHLLLAKNSNYGPNSLNGWLDEAWFLTGIHQKFYSFRENNDDKIKLFAVYNEDGQIDFCIKNNQGEFLKRTIISGIKFLSFEKEKLSRLWIKFDYTEALKAITNNTDDYEKLKKASEKFGEINIRKKSGSHVSEYSDWFGMNQ